MFVTSGRIDFRLLHHTAIREAWILKRPYSYFHPLGYHFRDLNDNLVKRESYNLVNLPDHARIKAASELDYATLIQG